MLQKSLRWFDDWFVLADVAPGVIAIGEPRFHQVNWNYLIIGRDRALLFDTGPGVRDISLVVKALTDLPVVALPSHMHFDHTGGLHLFSDVAMADLPVLRACESGPLFHASDDLFRGFREGMVWRPQRVSHWFAIGHKIDLGGRQLEVVHTPGHSPDSISLWDEGAGILFAADFVYLGALYAQIPGADLSDYLNSAEELFQRLPPTDRVFGAHGQMDGHGEHGVPELAMADIADLAHVLRGLKASGDMPIRHVVNSNMYLLLAPRLFAAWQMARNAI